MKSIANISIQFFMLGVVLIGVMAVGVYELVKWALSELLDALLEAGE